MLSRRQVRAWYRSRVGIIMLNAAVTSSPLDDIVLTERESDLAIEFNLAHVYTLNYRGV